MKILHVVPSYKPAYIYGGPIESVARLCEGLVKSGNTIHVFTTTANGKTELDVTPGERVDVNGVQVTYFKRITKDPTHISPDLWKQLNKSVKAYDIVHIHSWWNILVIVAAWICHKNKVKVIISPRGMLSSYIMTATNSLFKKLIHGFVGKKALSQSVFHATADSEYQECKQLIPGWQGFILPNILNLPAIKIDKKINTVFTLIFLSRIHPKKGIELLFEAIREIQFPVLLKIAGSGEQAYLEDLKKKAITLGIAEKIEWLGWKDHNEKFNELMQADLFVLTSFNENFANVVIESLHVGTPVLISDQVGLASFVQESNAGWVTALEVSSIKKAIGEAFTNSVLRAEINKNSREIIRKNFSESVLIGKYEKNYQTYARAGMEVKDLKYQPT